MAHHRLGVVAALNQEAKPEGDRLAAFGYRQELSRVLSLFDNFAVAFSYLSPMVGIYSLYTLGLGSGGPRYIWTLPVVVGCMTLVALAFGELASEYPLSGALYQYGKYSVGSRYGWFIGWIYGFALLATVASVDSGAVTYVAALSNAWFGTHLDPANHLTIVLIAGGIVVLSAVLNSTGARIMGAVARFGVYVETIGTFGVFLALAIAGFHQRLGFLFSSQDVEFAKSNPLGVDFGGDWWTAAALVAVLANVYIFYGFESAGDISEETVDAQRQVPKAMVNALLYGGIASFVLVLGLLLATPVAGIGSVVTGGINTLLATLPAWLQTFFLIMVVVAFFSCGTAVQGAGARVAYALARDGALPLSDKLRRISPSHRTPANAILVGTIVPLLFLLLVAVNPSKPVHIAWFDYPANVNALYALVSFATSGIYLAFFLTVLGALIARLRGWKPSGAFTLGAWGMPVTIGGCLYLLAMLVNIVWPSPLDSGRAIFNYGWVTLLVMAAIVATGAVYEAVARPDRNAGRIVVEPVSEPTGELRDLIAELDRALAREYLPEQQHGLSFESLFQPHTRFFIARLDGDAVGCGGVALFDEFGEVKRMFVRDEARGRGVAKALLARIELETAKRGLGLLRLETGDRQTAAIRLYERAGFARCDPFGAYLSMAPGAIATSLFYEKRLSVG